jgi:hypothetical protein
MQQFQKQIVSRFKTIVRVIFVDCRADFLFILLAMALAFLATYAAGLIWFLCLH